MSELIGLPQLLCRKLKSILESQVGSPDRNMERVSDTSKAYSLSNFLLCTKTEAKLREEQGDVSYFEATPETREGSITKRKIDPVRAVRRFYRSSSEDLHRSTATGEISIRSVEILQLATIYLIDNVWNNTSDFISILVNIHASQTMAQSTAMFQYYLDKPTLLSSVYGFVMDRLAAVRQDISMQFGYVDTDIDTPSHHRISPIDELLSVARILITILRFYLNCAYVIRMCRGYQYLMSNIPSDPTPWFDVALHQKAFAATLASLHAILSTDIVKSHVSDEISIISEEVKAYYLLQNQLIILQDLFSTSSRLSEVIARLNSWNSSFAQEMRYFNENKIDSYPDAYRYRCTKLVWKIIIAVRRGNPAKILKEVGTCLSFNASHEAGDIKDRSAEDGLKLILLQYIPLARMWRLLLANRAGNKSEAMAQDSIRRKLRLPILSMDMSQDMSRQRIMLRNLYVKLHLRDAEEGSLVYLNDPSIGNDVSYGKALICQDAYGYAADIMILNEIDSKR